MAERLRRKVRDDFAEFWAWLGDPLPGWQVPAFAKLIVLLLAARQVGKTSTLARYAIWRAVRKPGQFVVVAAPSEEGARRVLEHVVRLIRAHPRLMAAVVDEQLGVVEFVNGSKIVALTGSEASRRGPTATDLLIDEAQLIPRAQVEALIPQIAAREGAHIVMAGTAGVSEGVWYDLCVDGETGSEHIEFHRWVPTVVGGDCRADWIQPSFIAAAKTIMSPNRFDAEFRAIAGSIADAAIPLPVIQAGIADYRTTPLDAMQPRAKTSVGIDWGERADRTCLVALARFAQANVFGVCTVKRWGAGASIPGVCREIAASPMAVNTYWAERNGIGAAAVQMLWEKVTLRPAHVGGGRRPHGVLVIDEGGDRSLFPPRPRPKRSPEGGEDFQSARMEIFTDSALKSAMIGALRIGLEDGWLVLPACETELISELMHLKSTLTATGERIEAAPGRHDDLVMALCFALAPVRPKGRKAWHSNIQALTRRHIPPVVLPPQVMGLPAVTTEGDVEVPKYPSWQSVAGSAITPTPHVDLSPPEPRQIARARELIHEQRQEASNAQ